MERGVNASGLIEQIFREQSGQILATLISTVRDFALAEDALQDAVVTALQQWTVEGVPRNPAAWLTTVARRKAIDRLRRDAILARKRATLEAVALLEQSEIPAGMPLGDGEDAADIPDERLKLLFTCCHPALALEARVALTLRTLGGLAY